MEEAAFYAVEDTAYASQPSFISTPSSFSKAEASFVAIMDLRQHMLADFGSRLNHLSDEMC